MSVSHAVKAMFGSLYSLLVEIGSEGRDVGLKAIDAVGALQELPGIKGVPGAYELVVFAGQMAYAEAYKYVYYVSIAFGGVSIIAACFLGDISKYMDDHVAVVMH